jgi:hypothetical protein
MKIRNWTGEGRGKRQNHVFAFMIMRFDTEYAAPTGLVYVFGWATTKITRLWR